jgi:hypothetical protein
MHTARYHGSQGRLLEIVTELDFLKAGLLELLLILPRLHVSHEFGTGLADFVRDVFPRGGRVHLVC